ncbi:hypothetical protein HGRIS_013400 [Hohenbuehelia grisea]|uniref:Uncharacterized protein n=1 Tax=Hohenbuehelia grisea TaxID=104357 RepID=A0ABR3IVL8_9AGAR
MVALAFVFTSCLAIWALAYPLPRSGLAPAAVTPDASILGYSSISSGAVQVEAPSALTGTVSPRALLPKIFKKLSAAKTSPKPQSQRVQKPPPVAQRPAQPPVQPLRSTDDPTPPQSSPDAKAKIADLAADFLKDNGGALCNNLLDGACQDKTDQGSQNSAALANTGVPLNVVVNLTMPSCAIANPAVSASATAYPAVPPNAPANPAVSPNAV